MKVEAPYANPYVAGVALGLVLLAAFVLTGRGLGASGAFASSAASLAQSFAPERTSDSAYLQRYLAEGPFWRDWLVFELVGAACGGALSAWLADRWRFAIERGPGTSVSMRLATALLGGIAMGFGALLARGCTSGQALSGGALLSVGSWVFMLAAFVGAYAFAPLVRSLWR